MIGRILVGVGAAVVVGAAGVVAGKAVIARRQKQRAEAEVKPLSPQERLDAAKAKQATACAAYQAAKATEDCLHGRWRQEAVSSPEWHAAYEEYRAAYRATTSAFNAYIAALKATNAALDAVYGEPKVCEVAAA